MEISKQLSQEFGIREEYTKNIMTLIEDGSTIPFIARYRKEMHGACDDQVLREIADRLAYLENLNKRKKEVADSIEELGRITPEILLALQIAKTMTEVEDVYRPFKKKKKTRAMAAQENGLEVVAECIMSGNEADLQAIAIKMICTAFDTVDKVILGGKDIIAEKASDDAEMRKILRIVLQENAMICSKIIECEKSSTYEMYKEYSERASVIPSHRILAINRGEKEECLKVSITVDEEMLLAKLFAKHITPTCNKQRVEEALRDGLVRLILPSLERELRSDLTDKANEQAIKMFELNLQPLLLQPPLKNKTILALDPGYRTGCKVAIINSNGEVLSTDVVYPTPPFSQTEQSEIKLTSLIYKHNVDVIAIGNGTATKETEIFAVGLIKKLSRPIKYAIVNESGASVYSASKLGAEEFPQFDVSVRSAVSLARRLQDPLAELIKIDVKSIGVGQYQHDMPQKRLSEVLEGVVEDCVNNVGVDLNTASYSLLAYISGLNTSIAKNIVAKRTEKPFTARKELLKVAKLGAKAYEQCAGFLRISESKNVLDNTSVHPESYSAVEKLLDIFGYKLCDIAGGNLGELPNKIKAKGEAIVAKEVGVGIPTLKDIVAELQKPGRDIREDLPEVELRADLLDIKNLCAGMVLEGVARNITDFGAFVDIGVHQDGLVHISQMSKSFIKHPSDVLKLGDRVRVRVIDVDTQKNRISLSMFTDEEGEKSVNDSRQQERSNLNKQNSFAKAKVTEKKQNKTTKEGEAISNNGDLASMLAALQKKFK